MMITLNEEQIDLLNNTTEYQEIITNRAERYSQAYTLYINQQWTVFPRPSRQELEARILRYQSIDIPAIIRDRLVLQTQSKIDSNDFSADGTEEYQNRQNYLTYLSNFQWPTQDENALRAQEDNQLLALING